MSTYKDINFERITRAIEYMYVNAQSQPELEEIASQVHMSPFHFQRMFQAWAGVSPKKFLQYLTVNRAKKALKDGQLSLFDTADKIGLSGTGRLHDLFVKIEGMTPGEYKNGGKNLRINYCYSTSLFGEMLIASTGKGICYLAFSFDKLQMSKELKELFPGAAFVEQTDELIEKVIHFFEENLKSPKTITLHLKGTEFQLKVWETLLKIPEGELSTYGAIAEQIHNPKATRAVGSAVGDNPVSYLIPCHRVIRSTGVLGQYHCGPALKKAMIGWEAVRNNS
ncbi:MAG: bifunctional helix-turn-helix domain-containing protein/methylated-DNA--[protein]-cysteine S-methyltransferase [Paludibacteraceae bacterium]